MKRHTIILISVLTIGIIYFIFNYFKVSNKTEINIVLVKVQKHTTKDLSCKGLLNNWDWSILSSIGQQKNWESEGYLIPAVDFNKNYLIMSKYKILKLYRTSRCNKCLGVPEGKAVFDKSSSEYGYYYFYLMPKLMLSQGVG